MWCFDAIPVWSLSNASSFALTYANCIFIACILNFGIFIPTSPGAIGTFEFIVVKGLSLFHIAKPNALCLVFSCIL